jgi:chromate transporter
MTGILLPSTLLTCLAARWGHRNRDLRVVRAFKQGMTPIVLALLVATGWILATGRRYELAQAPLWALSIASTVIVWRTRLHLLWLLGAGAALGWIGLV